MRQRLGPGATDAACLLQGVRELVLDNVDPQQHDRLGATLEVLVRHDWQCGSALCRRRRDLHGHHVRFRSRGGSNKPDNIMGLCWRCHRLLHAGFMTITGTAAEGFTQVVGDEAWREGLLVEPADAARAA